jgi:hypothetical protein
MKKKIIQKNKKNWWLIKRKIKNLQLIIKVQVLFKNIILIVKNLIKIRLLIKIYSISETCLISPFMILDLNFSKIQNLMIIWIKKKIIRENLKILLGK